MEKISGIKAVSFDGDGTLWDFQKIMRDSLGRILTDLKKADPIAASRLNVEKMIEIRHMVAEKYKGKATKFEVIRLEAFKQALRDVNRPNDSLAERLNDLYYKYRFETTLIYDDVLPVLSKLQKKYKLGLLSNGNTYPERCGLDGVFHFVLFAQDIGIEKPDPVFYQYGIEKSGYDKEQLLHVGDSLENDVIGANAVGIKTVWLNREQLKPESKVKINYEIQSLTGLLELI